MKFALLFAPAANVFNYFDSICTSLAALRWCVWSVIYMHVLVSWARPPYTCCGLSGCEQMEDAL